MTHNITLEAEITPGMPVQHVIELARLAEDVGFDRLGISDVVFWHDCFMLLGLVAQSTSRVELGPMVTNPYSRHPAVLAGIAATLHDVSNGRAFMGIGVGAGLEAVGETYPRPVAHVRDAVTVMRALLRGETVNYQGETITVNDSRLQHVDPLNPAHVPMSIGTRSPQMMRLAGEIADIALVGGRYLSPSLAANYRTFIVEGAQRIGRDVASVEVAPRVTLCVSSDGDLARRSVKRYVAHYIALIRPAELNERMGLDADWYARVDAALARSTGWYFDHDRYDDPEIFSLIADELVTSFAIVGTPDECKDLARGILDLGFNSISMNLSFPVGNGMYQGLRDTLEGFGTVIDAVRSGR
jgi:5,10-methylenetetrahydromethanopterin reductase